MNIIQKEIKSFGHAIRGIKFLFQSQTHARFHLFAALVSIFLIIYLNGTALEIGLIFLASASVLAAEAFNTAIENLTDLVSPEWNAAAGRVKDISAGGVLICACFAAATGFLILAPKVFYWFCEFVMLDCTNLF